MHISPTRSYFICLRIFQEQLKITVNRAQYGSVNTLYTHKTNFTRSYLSKMCKSEVWPESGTFRAVWELLCKNSWALVPAELILMGPLTAWVMVEHDNGVLWARAPLSHTQSCSFLFVWARQHTSVCRYHAGRLPGVNWTHSLIRRKSLKGRYSQKWTFSNPCDILLSLECKRSIWSPFSMVMMNRDFKQCCTV